MKVTLLTAQFQLANAIDNERFRKFCFVIKGSKRNSLGLFTDCKVITFQQNI
jgi:hypothetical protein